MNTRETQLRDVLPKIEGQVQEFFPTLEAMLPKLEEKIKMAEEKLKETFSPENQIVHPAVCDQCNQRIVGIRWKCQSCPDFDLCNSCRQLKGGSHEHQFTKLTSTSYGTRPTRCPFVPKEEAKPETPKQEKKDEVPKVEILKPLIPLRIPVKVQETKVEPVVVVPQPIIVPQPVVVVPQPVVAQEKIESPKQEKKESPFESKLKQLEEMGFSNRVRNIEFLVMRKGDMIHVVKDLLE